MRSKAALIFSAKCMDFFQVKPWVRGTLYGGIQGATSRRRSYGCTMLCCYRLQKNFVYFNSTQLSITFQLFIFPSSSKSFIFNCFLKYKYSLMGFVQTIRLKTVFFLNRINVLYIENNSVFLTHSYKGFLDVEHKN